MTGLPAPRRPRPKVWAAISIRRGRVYRLTERTIDKHGNTLLLAEYVLEGWTTTLPEKFNCAEVIALYCDHATHGQFHSEFKSDMDLERLPSGKFDANYLVCQLAAVAMNLLRLIGQNTLNEPDAPVRRCAGAPQSQTPSYQDGDAGVDVHGSSDDYACRALGIGSG